MVLITVYYGALPFWLPAFLLSCRYNPDVEWFVVTDSAAPVTCPANVKFISLPLGEFNRLCSDKLGFSVNIRPTFAYKICDLRPAFGRIFEDYIRDHQFYGHADLDVVWGHFGTFVTREMLDRFDIITSRIRNISGHCCLFRNVPDVTTIFTRMPGYREMVQDETYRCADEQHLTAHLHDRLRPGRWLRFRQMLPGKPAAPPRVYWARTLTTNDAMQQRVGEHGEPSLRWKNGRTFATDGAEMMYLHFHKIRHSMSQIDFGYRDDPAEFRITRTGFFAAPPAPASHAQ
jgi:hypothetical protein